MKTIDLTNGRQPWDSLFDQLAEGDALLITPALGKAACSAARSRGFIPRLRTVGESSMITLLCRDTKVKPGLSKTTLIHAAQSRHNDVRARISEAKENLGYWRRQKLIRENHQARIEAGARVLLWGSPSSASCKTRWQPSRPRRWPRSNVLLTPIFPES